MTRLLGVLLIALALGACGKKEEAPNAAGGAGPAAMMAAAPEASAKQAEGAERRFLAYEHRVSLEVDAPQLERLYRELQDACVNETTWHCTVMDASIQLERDERGGTAHLNLRASPEGVRTMRKRLADSGGVVSQGTHVDDLGQPIAEVSKRLDMLKTYRASLLDLQRKATKVEDLILIAEKLSETQSELEAATGQSAQLMDRVNREVLSIDLSTRQTTARSLWAPIGNALREFPPSLVHASASVISAVAYLLPWVIVLSIVSVLIARVRRKRRQQKSAD
ncbi:MULTISPECIES: DUF4349 domain-containing protein [Ralstonia]|jgi:hypothetical protein|uniref:DUF4349 domain-containing protein n=1 Tax=Ralstonia flaminis TaxID=3058597 RepID=A0ABM9K053_9RALS|nr:MULTISPECIES: DUF4349 domain-containing protein [unclassified Ralstonia]CAJ0809874.1 hypothetical protein LMG18101_00693 [Ralstonia sp. LMG 18101]